MKKLLVTLLLLSIALPVSSWADHIGIYSDATGTSTDIPCGFTQTVAIIEKFSTGSTGCRFKVTFPPGSTLFAFNSPYVHIGLLTQDMSVGYGGDCLSTPIVLGTIIAVLAPGTARVEAADLEECIISMDCAFVEHCATGGIGTIGHCPVPTESRTWGSVKALYR